MHIIREWLSIMGRGLQNGRGGGGQVNFYHYENVGGGGGTTSFGVVLTQVLEF